MDIIIDTNADIDALLREVERINKNVKSSAKAENQSGRRDLTWKDIYTDAVIEDLFQERLSSVMGAAKSQRAIHFHKELLQMGRDDEITIDVLAPHLRILPESAIHSKSKQEERKAAFREAKMKALEDHKEKMLRLAMQGLELPRADPEKNATAAAAVAASDNNEEHEDKKENDDDDDDDGNPPPPPPPPGDEDSDSDSDDDDDDDDDDMPPPPPPDDDDDGDDSDSDDDDVPPPPPPPPED